MHGAWLIPEKIRYNLHLDSRLNYVGQATMIYIKSILLNLIHITTMLTSVVYSLNLAHHQCKNLHKIKDIF